MVSVKKWVDNSHISYVYLFWSMAIMSGLYKSVNIVNFIFIIFINPLFTIINNDMNRV